MTTKHNRPAGANGGAATAANDTTFQPQHSSSTHVRSTPVRRADGRIVGELRGDVLTKTAKREHQLREPAAWAWDTAILDAAERAGARFTEVECGGLVYRATLADFNWPFPSSGIISLTCGLVYRATLADFNRYGFPVRRGHGDQRGLALAHWHVRRVGEPPAAVQLSLFGGAR